MIIGLDTSWYVHKNLFWSHAINLKIEIHVTYKGSLLSIHLWLKLWKGTTVKVPQKSFVYIQLPWIIVYTKVFLICFNSGPYIRSQTYWQKQFLIANQVRYIHVMYIYLSVYIYICIPFWTDVLAVIIDFHLLSWPCTSWPQGMNIITIHSRYSGHTTTCFDSFQVLFNISIIFFLIFTMINITSAKYFFTCTRIYIQCYSIGRSIADISRITDALDSLVNFQVSKI